MVARHASLLFYFIYFFLFAVDGELAFYSAPSPLGQNSGVDFDGRLPKLNCFCHFFIGVDMMNGL